jgi:GNAT superfamily N-acetyltransferase
LRELGGPLPREGIDDKVARDGQEASAGDAWKMIVPDEAAPEVVAGFQGHGLAKRAVRMLLELARDDGRWGLVHAFPATTNNPSNGICRSLGFRCAGEQDVTSPGRVLRSSHWVINPAIDLA